MLTIQRFQSLFFQIELKEKWKVAKMQLFNRNGSFLLFKVMIIIYIIYRSISYESYGMTHTVLVIWVYIYSSIFLHGRLFGLEATVRSETF